MNKQDIKLKEIPEPLWTDELLLHFIKYGWNEYGFVKINSYKDQAEYINSLKEVISKLRGKSSPPRKGTRWTSFFVEIYNKIEMK